MDLLQLRYFYDSANYLSISKTAEKYGVPPTSVSASIRRLERELDCKLFERTANRIMLNDKGKIMQSSLNVIFDELDKMVNAVSNTADDTKEIKILMRALRSLITDYIIQYKSKHTHTRFKMVADFDETNYADYDIIVDTESNSYTGYEKLVLGKQKILLYASSDSPLCSRSLKLEQLAKEPFVIMSKQRDYGKALKAACERANFTPEIVAQINDSACFRKIISSGTAIGITGELAENVDGTTNLAPLNVTDFKYEQTICMYYKKEDNHGNTARFMNFIRENIRKDNGLTFFFERK